MSDAKRFWIAFGDIHQRVAAVDRVEDLAQASGVLLNGDLTNIGMFWMPWRARIRAFSPRWATWTRLWWSGC